MEKKNELEEKLQKIIKQKKDENEVLKKLLEHLENDISFKNNNKENANNKNINKS